MRKQRSPSNHPHHTSKASHVLTIINMQTKTAPRRSPLTQVMCVYKHDYSTYLRRTAALRWSQHITQHHSHQLSCKWPQQPPVALLQLLLQGIKLRCRGARASAS
jgi:hypothetical protein